MTTQHAGKDEEKLDHSCIAGGNIKSYSHFGNSLTILCKIKCVTTTWPSNHSPVHLPQRNKNSCPHKSLYTNNCNCLFLIEKIGISLYVF